MCHFQRTRKCEVVARFVFHEGCFLNEGMYDYSEETRYIIQLLGCQSLLPDPDPSLWAAFCENQ